MFQSYYQARQHKRHERQVRRDRQAKARAARRRLRHEILEDRRMFALLGVEPLDYPLITYDIDGTVSYDSSNDAFSLNSTPISYDSGSSSGGFFSGALSINIQVNGAGALIGGVPGDDFILTGDVDTDGDFVVDYSGTLLTGEVLGFGFQDSGGATDNYDFRIQVTGGQLAGEYSGKDLGVVTTSENSTFAGDFAVDFGGNAKGSIGAIEPNDPGIDIEKFTNGVDADDAADAPEIVAGDDVTFTYAVTNTGSVAFAYDDVDVTDDSGTPGDLSDDVSTMSGDLILDASSDVGGDLILSPGEVWIYEYTTAALDLDPSEDNCGCDVGTYENLAVVTVPGATDSDLSHYTNPSDAPPCITYDIDGLVSYDSSTDHLTLHATPIATEDGGFFFSGDIDIDIIVNSLGVLVGGVPGDDFVLQGDYDEDGDFVVDYSGVLLTGEILSVVAVDSGGATDNYEFTFTVTGGLLAAQYMGLGLKVTTTSENSTFTGSFATDFSGNAKGEICCFCLEDASLSGHKYTDQTGDGISGDDTPLADVTINLYQDFGTIGVLDGADVLYASDVTDIDGEYSFEMLVPGNYLVEEIVPAGYVPTTATIYAVTLAAGDHITTGFDFANFELGSISGKKFNDIDGDGSDDGGSDPGLAGWTIELDRGANGTVDATTVTGPGGVYTFTGLTAGTYRIREVGQVGWIQTTVNPGDVSVVSGTNDTTGNDFGNFQLGAISGKKFNDVDGDGSDDGGSDPGLAGWTIELDRGANGTVDATTVTGPGGVYTFTGLTAGTYRIREVGQVGWIQTTVNPGDVSVVSGTNDTTGNDFGNFQLGAISGKKFNDIDGDGSDDGGSDPGLAGWTIELDRGANGTVDATTVTGPGGVYTFTGLTAGTYRIREVGQVGWIQTTVNPGDVSVVSGTNDTTGNDFGNFQLGAISGKKFNDVDGDGSDDGGSDPGLAGWTIELDRGANGTVDATTVTGPGGVYTFTGLTAGTYRIREVGQVGWIQTTVNPGDVSVVSGTNDTTGNDFGNFQLGAISGKKFNDVDGDGSDDGGSDPGLAGWTIELDRGANGTVDATTVTGPGGVYTFTGLTAGTYRIREVGQVGWIQTTVNPGDVSVVSGTNDTTGNDFGNFQLGAISGKKFNDVDGDGSDDGGSDPGLAGWTIELDRGANGTVDATTVTGPGGVYTFTGLTAGTYRIREVGQVGWIQTTVNPGDVSVVSGTNDTTGNDFGNFQLGAISGKKFNDVDGDGSDDGGSDPGLAGWTIELDRGANGTVDATTVTGPGGVYTFTGLTAGTYRIREVGQVGWIQTTVNPGDVSVVSGTNDTTGNDFGNFQLGAISGKKFNDVDGDGSDDGGSDPGLAGWTIELDRGANGTVDATTVTGPGGVYTFTGLTAGTYRIREVGQVGWIQTTVNPGDVSVVSGTNDTTGNDFGNRQLVPGIDIEKTTNGPSNSNPTAPDYDNEDSENGPGVPILTPGSTVTWTYKVTNTGQTNYSPSQVVIVDDHGTPGNAADDLSTTNGQITFLNVQAGDADNILEPGEVWLYQASGIVQDQGGGGPAVTFNMSGSSSLDGTDGNMRTFTAGGLSVKASAFSRDTSGVWSTAWLGSYGGGLGVTDSGEGDGSNNNHTVDNIGRDNYVLFEFSDTVVIDSAFLGYVVEDSDLRIWIGTKTDPFNNHQTLSDAFLSSLGFTEVNETTLTTTRWADLNAGGISGNVIVIAANTGEATTEDKFKIEKLTVTEHACYENRAVITVPGATDSDLSHYCTTEGEPGIDIKKYTNGQDADSESGAPQIAPGDTVTWTYTVTNTGTTSFTAAQIVVTDDAGTPGSTGDDFHPTRILSTDVGNDGILSPGEVWTYQASDVAEDLGSGPASTFNFSGSSATSGTAGNTRTFSAGGVSVKTSAFSRDSSGVWSTAYLGSYGGGLGVTDSSEGTGGSNSHTVDNIGRDNYVLFEFSESVVVDSTFLGYVVDDSDLRIWIGTATDAFNNHLTLSDAVLASLGFTEVNETTLTTTRLADLNAGGIAGNVLVIAANTAEGTTEDQFKIEKLTFDQHLCYQNYAVVTTGAGGPTDSDVSHYCNPTTPPAPGIVIEKYTNGVDADTAAEAPEIAPGQTVTWTYKVTNTGTVAFSASEVVVKDDNGTVSNTADDFSPTFVASSDVGNDGILSAGEMWTYTASAIAQDLMTPGAASQFNFAGSTATTGTAGNIRTFTAGGVSVKTSAFSRDKTTAAWSSAYLGSYSGGLGVTDGSENGSSNTHTVDNNSTRDNYVLFEFSQSVVVDSAFLGYVVTDSDMSVWIGSTTDPFNNHLTLSDAVLSGLGFTEVNAGGSGTRTADLNAGQISGNVLIIAAKKGETNDYFKIQKLDVRKLELGIYKNVGRVTADGVSDDDVSHYRNPECVDADFVFAGSTSTTGTNGNVRSYSVNGVSVNASAYSRTTSGTWSTAYLGAYSDGLGVTDTSENGASGTHRLDNVGQMNFVLFEFSTLVEIDRAFLDSVATDSDVTILFGTANNPYHNHLTLSDALAGTMSYYETDNTESTAARWADFESGSLVGNVLIIAASVEDTTPDDQFKISKLDVCAKAVKFYTVDATSDKTFEYGASGQALANYSVNSANTNSRGVATTAANTKVWVIDGGKKVYVYDTNGVLQGSWTPNGLTTPEDITTNGTDIWIVDDGSNKVFKYSGGTGAGANRTSGSQTAASSFTLNSANANAKGIVTNGTHLWVVNDTSTTDSVFKYTTSGTLVGSWTIDSANGSPTGITIDPSNVNHLWITDSADDAVYRYNGGTARTTGSQTASHVFQLAGGNGDVQGIADPPPGGSPIESSTAADDRAALLFETGLADGVYDRALTNWAPTTSGRRPGTDYFAMLADRGDFSKAIESAQMRRSTSNVRDQLASVSTIVTGGPRISGSDCLAVDEVFESAGSDGESVELQSIATVRASKVNAAKSSIIQRAKVAV